MLDEHEIHAVAQLAGVRVLAATAAEIVADAKTAILALDPDAAQYPTSPDATTQTAFEMLEAFGTACQGMRDGLASLIPALIEERMNTDA